MMRVLQRVTLTATSRQIFPLPLGWKSSYSFLIVTIHSIDQPVPQTRPMLFRIGQMTVSLISIPFNPCHKQTLFKS